MNSKLKTVVFGGLIAGSLMMSAAPAMARDWRDNDRNHRWEETRGRYDGAWGRNDRVENRNDGGWYDPAWGRLNGSRNNMEALQQARQQALYDASHGASRKKIAQDNAVVDEMVNQMRYGR
jgi:hypothetical protein